MAPIFGHTGRESIGSCDSDQIQAFPDWEINKADSPPPPTSSLAPEDALPQEQREHSSSSPLRIRSRRDRNSQQKSARQQRSATTSLLLTKQAEAPPAQPKFHRSSTSLSPAEALAATEPPHEHRFKTKMAYEDQQKWITVQQKTFTKWYALGGE